MGFSGRWKWMGKRSKELMLVRIWSLQASVLFNAKISQTYKYVLWCPIHLARHKLKIAETTKERTCQTNWYTPKDTKKTITTNINLIKVSIQKCHKNDMIIAYLIISSPDGRFEIRCFWSSQEVAVHRALGACFTLAPRILDRWCQLKVDFPVSWSQYT